MVPPMKLGLDLIHWLLCPYIIGILYMHKFKHMTGIQEVKGQYQHYSL